MTPVIPQQPAPEPPATFVHARTAKLIVEVIGTKSQKPTFDAEMNRILRTAGQTKLWTNFGYVSGPNVDLIIKIRENQTLIGSETISLTVFNPVNNKKLWSETRDLVDLDNDVSRLIAHFLSEVSQEKKRAKEDAERASKKVPDHSNHQPKQ